MSKWEVFKCLLFWLLFSLMIYCHITSEFTTKNKQTDIKVDLIRFPWSVFRSCRDGNMSIKLSRFSSSFMHLVSFLLFQNVAQQSYIKFSRIVHLYILDQVIWVHLSQYIFYYYHLYEVRTDKTNTDSNTFRHSQRFLLLFLNKVRKGESSHIPAKFTQAEAAAWSRFLFT